MMSNEKRHLIILTRPRPLNGCGSTDDEWFQIWKQGKSDPKLLVKDCGSAKLTVIHGCHSDYTSTDSAEIIGKVNKIVLDLLKKDDEILGVLLHGVDEKDARAALIPNGDFNKKIKLIKRFEGKDSKFFKPLADKAVADSPFLKEFDDVWARFKLNWKLEAKLQLLHLCQTPAGAKKLFGADCPQLVGEGKFWSKKIQIDDEFWKTSEETDEQEKTVQKAIEKLGEYKDSDCFSPNYIEVLKAIRNSLLNGRN